MAVVLVAACGDDGDESSSSEPVSSERHHEVDVEGLETWQTDLSAVGCWVGPVDGELGPRTEAATRELQEADGLTVDGLIGAETEEAPAESAAEGGTVCGEVQSTAGTPTTDPPDDGGGALEASTTPAPLHDGGGALD